MLGSEPSTISWMPPCLLAKSRPNTTAMSAFWLRMSLSASCGVAAVFVMVKYSDWASRSITFCVRWSLLAVTTTVRTFFTSVEMAKPKISIITTGMPKRMSIVRLSRRMCLPSLMTKERKGPSEPSRREGCFTACCLASIFISFYLFLIMSIIPNIPPFGRAWVGFSPFGLPVLPGM